MADHLKKHPMKSLVLDALRKKHFILTSVPTGICIRHDSLYNFYKDQDLLFLFPRYERVRAAKTPEAQAAMLYACGYATDSAYSSKLLSIIKANNLTRFDEIEEDNDVLKLSDTE